MGPTVVVVEDDVSLARSITRNLGARGYVTRTVASVAGALNLIADVHPQVVVLDIDLPDGSGWDVMRGLPAASTEKVPTIIMSALRPNRRLTAEFGAAGVLEKPFPMESLLRLVAECTHEEPAGRTRGF